MWLFVLIEQGSLGNPTLIRPFNSAKSLLYSYAASDGGDAESISGIHGCSKDTLSTISGCSDSVTRTS